MTPMLLEGPDVLILLGIVVLLFGGAKLAGLGKSAGRALREFKEETRGLAQTDHEARPDDTKPSQAEHAAQPARRVHDVGLTRPGAAPAPSTPIPSTPSASTPAPSTPIPSTPSASTPAPSTPTASAPTAPSVAPPSSGSQPHS